MGRGFYGNGKGESRESRKVQNNDKRVKNAQRKVECLEIKAQKKFRAPLDREQTKVALSTWVKDPNCSAEKILKNLGLLSEKEGEN